MNSNILKYPLIETQEIRKKVLFSIFNNFEFIQFRIKNQNQNQKELKFLFINKKVKKRDIHLSKQKNGKSKKWKQNINCHYKWWNIYIYLSLGYVILLDSSIPKVTIFFIELPYVHGIIVINHLVSSSSFHIVYVRFKVVGFIRFIHLNNAKYNYKYACCNVQVFPLKNWNLLVRRLYKVSKLRMQMHCLYSNIWWFLLPEHWSTPQEQWLVGRAMT